MQTDTSLLPLPEKLEVRETFSQLTISYRWMRPIYYIYLVFLLFFCFLCVTFYKIYSSEWPSGDTIDPFLTFFKIAFTVNVSYIAYYTLGGFLNSTIITVDSKSIGVTNKPLPWMGAKTIPRGSIQQLYTIQHVQSGRGQTITYRVMAVTTDHKSVTVVRGLETAQQARFIEQKMEQYMNIESREVPGEYKGGLEEPKGWFG